MSLFGATLATGGAALAADPMASNNGLYPTAEEWSGPLRVAYLEYPTAKIEPGFELGDGNGGALSVETAEAYARKIKTYLEPTMKLMINDSEKWDPEQQGWYDLVWSGEGEAGDSTSGREAISNSYTGQILPPTVFQEEYRPTRPDGKPVYIQNHAVIYYNDVAASMLGKAFGNLYRPDPKAVRFPQGSVVVKAEATTPTPEEWPILKGAATWHVFRPTTDEQKRQQQGKPADLTPVVVTTHPLQMSIKVKDNVASPDTGWVYMGFVYKFDAPGETPWDRFVPIGVMWGNDPEQATFADGVDPARVQGDDLYTALEETWINPNAPAFTLDTLGWGDRLAGPMDVATRSGVITPSGKRYEGADNLRASSCMSCHGASEFPFTTNLYPSPNRSFPPNGDPFLLYDPGSTDWVRWFQNRPGNEPMSPNIGANAGLDYDMAIMFALSSFNAAFGNDGYVQERFDVH